MTTKQVIVRFNAVWGGVATSLVSLTYNKAFQILKIKTKYQISAYPKIMKTLQVKQLKQACQENKYLIASYINGAEGGINCQISAYVLKNKEYRDEKHTKILSVYPCSFMEYISLKSPFVRK